MKILRAIEQLILGLIIGTLSVLAVITGAWFVFVVIVCIVALCVLYGVQTMLEKVENRT